MHSVTRSVVPALLFLVCVSPLRADWIRITQLPADSITTLYRYSNTEFYAGTANMGVFKSPDRGSTWSAVNSGLTNLDIRVVAYNLGYLYAGTANGFFMSSDQGASWTDVSAGLTTKDVRAIGGYSTLVVGTSGGGIFVSTDYGSHWGAALGITNPSILSLTNTATAYMFAGTAGSGVFVSTNYGATWMATTTQPTSKDIESLILFSGSLFAGTHDGVYRSTDNGVTWTAANAGMAGAYVGTLTADGTTLFAGTSLGVFRSFDLGTTWTAVNTGIAGPDIQSLAVSGSFMFAGTKSGGLWRRTISEMTDVPAAAQLPTAISLEQNYPNPFSGSTAFAFTLEKEAHVLVDVVDLYGRVVDNIVADNFSAGNHAVQWNAARLPDGVYSVRLRSGGVTRSRCAMIAR